MSESQKAVYADCTKDVFIWNTVKYSTFVVPFIAKFVWFLFYFLKKRTISALLHKQKFLIYCFASTSGQTNSEASIWPLVFTTFHSLYLEGKHGLVPAPAVQKTKHLSSNFCETAPSRRLIKWLLQQNVQRFKWHVKTPPCISGNELLVSKH